MNSLEANDTAAVERPNFQHLFYFWIVAREGGINAASEVLDISASTISTQVRALERSIGTRLFERVGRGLRLNDAGETAFRYAEEIFVLGREMMHAVGGWNTPGPAPLRIGVADAVPKLVATRLLAPALKVTDIRLLCTENRPATLLAELALFHLDVVLLDDPHHQAVEVKARNHLLADWDLALFGADRAHGLGVDAPEGLEGAPLLLPTAESSIRRRIDRWFESRRVQPRVVGEFEDSALMKAFGERGLGLFPAPAVLAEELSRQHGVELVAPLEGCRVQYFAVTVERRLTPPAVAEICGEPA
ncbi:MAG: LysR family transcriptional regulator [Thermoanaerobaculia bacterium]|nr:LysR family transcriptional regulator [Thermoanaerobaculia bacterium]